MAPPGTCCHTQGEAASMPVAAPGSEGQRWTHSHPRRQHGPIGTCSALSKQQRAHGGEISLLPASKDSAAPPGRSPLPSRRQPGSYLQGLQVWPLFGHHSSQELVLQSLPGHQEVDQGALSLHLWLVVRVGVFGVQNQSEARVIFHFFISYPNASV